MAQTALGYASKYRAEQPTKRRFPKTNDIGKGNLTSNEVAKRTGATLRQLQWWDEQKLIMVRHQGHQRVYTPEDARKVAAVVQLRRHGFSLQRCRRFWKLFADPEAVQPILDACELLRKHKIYVR